MSIGTADMVMFDRLQFAATLIFHYLFPQLTMGLAFMLALFATRGYWRGHEGSKLAARFWTRIPKSRRIGHTGVLAGMTSDSSFAVHSLFQMP